MEVPEPRVPMHDGQNSVDVAQVSELVDVIRTGRAVAFVGAGFARNFAPGWSELLSNLNEEVCETQTGEQVTSLLSGNTSSRQFEAAAQLLRDAYDEAGTDFDQALTQAFVRLDETDSDSASPDRDRLKRRLELLDGIPFRAILTTNFDGYLPGGLAPGPSAYAKVLRGDAQWWDAAVADLPTSTANRPVVELHGRVGAGEDGAGASVVFTRQQYLQRVHGEPGYQEFLKALLMTSTVVFLGFSFSDAYINGLRNDVQSMFGHEPGQPPLAWAVMDSVDDQLATYLREHERIGVVQLGDNVATDFDAVLEQVHEGTNPARRVRDILAGKHVVWIDPVRENNEYGRLVIEGEHDVEGGARITQIEPEDHLSDWMEEFSEAGDPPGDPESGVDLVITHWGQGRSSTEQARAIEVLKAIRQEQVVPAAPVIVFAAGGHKWVRDNRRLALQHGATAFETEWSGLFREIARLFPEEQGRTSAARLENDDV